MVVPQYRLIPKKLVPAGDTVTFSREYEYWE